MFSNTLLLRKIFKFLKLAPALTLAAGLSAVPLTASAIVVDGIFTSGEGYSGTTVLPWYNDHKSIYTETIADQPGTTQTSVMRYHVTDTSLNLFVEVPTYARRMIWTDFNYLLGDDCTNPDDCGGLGHDFLDPYLAGSHHETKIMIAGEKVKVPSVNMGYKTQTDSEFFNLIGTGSISLFSDDVCFGLQDDGGHCDTNSTYEDPVDNVNENDGIYWQTSRDFLLDNNICDTDECFAFDTTMSLELVFRGLSAGEGQAILGSITKLRLHLSDEARGLPPVPVPAAIWLFGTALIGFIGMSMRTSVA